jgi:hypothetical protein
MQITFTLVSRANCSAQCGTTKEAARHCDRAEIARAHDAAKWQRNSSFSDAFDSRFLTTIEILTPRECSLPDDENPSETHDAGCRSRFVSDIGPSTRIFAEGCADRSMGRLRIALS